MNGNAGFLTLIRRLTGRHWLVWPLLTLLLLTVIHIFFFADNGYFAYQNMREQQDDLNRQITALRKKIDAVGRNLAELKDEDKTLKNFTNKYMINNEKMRILRFIELEDKKPEKPVQKYDLDALRRIFFPAAAVILAAVMLISYRGRSSEDDA